MASFFGQEEAAFETWFNQMKDQLSEDAAGNLQLEIDNIKSILNKTNEDLEDAISTITPEDGNYIATEDNKRLVAGM